jgi:hypothetical protein
MQKLYTKTKFGIKEIVHFDEAAEMLGIKPSTLSAYFAREHIYLKKIHIKNLVFFYKEDIEKFITWKKEQKKVKNDSMELF